MKIDQAIVQFGQCGNQPDLILRPVLERGRLRTGFGCVLEPTEQHVRFAGDVHLVGVDVRINRAGQFKQRWRVVRLARNVHDPAAQDQRILVGRIEPDGLGARLQRRIVASLPA